MTKNVTDTRKCARQVKTKAKHATPAWQEHQAVVEGRAAAKAPVKAKRERARVALDMSVPSPKTDRRYLKESVLPAYQRIAEGAPTRTDEQMIADFDRKYRPVVYRKMLDEKGAFQFKPVSVKIDNVTVMIPMRGNISGADIWTNVCTKLFKVALAKFDFTADKVGQGAFRSFLVTMAYHEYVSMVRSEKQKRRMVPARDIHGHVRHMFNKKHQWVPIMVPRETGDVDEEVVAVAECNNSLTVAAEKERKAAQELLLNEYYLAYLSVSSRMKQDGWMIRAMEDFFEKGEKREKIIERRLKEGSIKNRGAYDTASSRFLKEVRAERKRINRICLGSHDPESELANEWGKMASKVGVRRVLDIRGRILDAMLEKMKGRGKK